jgi:hypothetical protein
MTIEANCRKCQTSQILEPKTFETSFPMCHLCGLPMIAAGIAPMRALTLRQPWPWAILTQGKRIENRQWNTRHRGAFLLHASLWGRDVDRSADLEWMRSRGLARVDDCPPLDAPPDKPMFKLARGGIVGRARLVDVIKPYTTTYPQGVDPRWHDRDQYGFVLADVMPLPFGPCRGMPGFFEIRETMT